MRSSLFKDRERRKPRPKLLQRKLAPGYQIGLPLPPAPIQLKDRPIGPCSILQEISQAGETGKPRNKLLVLWAPRPRRAQSQPKLHLFLHLTIPQSGVAMCHLTFEATPLVDVLRSLLRHLAERIVQVVISGAHDERLVVMILRQMVHLLACSIVVTHQVPEINLLVLTSTSLDTVNNKKVQKLEVKRPLPELIVLPLGLRASTFLGIFETNSRWQP